MKINKYNATHNTSGRKSAPKFIVIHYTAGVKSTKGQAKNVCHFFALSTTKASADFVVDDQEIWQYNKDIKKRYTWAVGGIKQNTKGGKLYGKCTNDNSISIEICSTNSKNKIMSPNDKSWAFSSKSLENAKELVTYLMKTYNIDASHVIRHYDVTGKMCPGVPGWNRETNETKWKQFHDSFTVKLAKVKASDGLNLRNTQSSKTDSNIICTIPNGANVTYSEKGTSWTKVTYNGKTGYVYNKYLVF